MKGFFAARKASAKIVLLVKMVLHAYPEFPCFAGGARVVIKGLEDRFCLGMSKSAVTRFVNEELVNASVDNWRTRWYDRYQYCCQGIMM